MSGIAGQAVSHLVRRGLEQFPTASHGLPADFDTMTSAAADAEIIVTPMMIFVGVVVSVLTAIIVLSVDYTVGSVVTTLAMIESPSSTTIIESAPPAYSDEPDAPLDDKKIDMEAAEVIVIDHKPITASVFGTVKHLHRVGGFLGRWRGCLQAILYVLVAEFTGHIFARLFRQPFGHMGGQFVGSVLARLCLCRLHMLWTHAMIAKPSNTPWYKRFGSVRQSKALLLPTLITAVAPPATAVTVAVVAMGLLTPTSGFSINGPYSGVKIASLVLSALSVPVTFGLAVFYLLIPASASLARIEAALLPEDQETIVPFSREAIVGDLDLTQRGSSKKLFVSSWKSVSNSTRTRVAMISLKLVAFLVAVFLVAGNIIGGVFYHYNKEMIHSTINDFVM